MSPSASTRLIALLGDPVAQSVSPAIHNDAFEALSLDLLYVASAVSSERFRDALTGLHALGAVGANVTAPHKEVAWKMAETLSPTARAAGAVNTLVRTPTGWGGHNTDVDGFSAPLRGLGIELGGERAVVIGAGGAARAAVLALSGGFGFARVDVAARRVEQAEKLVRDLQPDGDVELHAVALGDADLGSRVIVNATSVGMNDPEQSPCNGAAFGSGQVIYDLVYGPTPTRFVREARESGATALDGLAMLVAQAAGAFKLWTGRDLPLDRATAVARSALSQP